MPVVSTISDEQGRFLARAPSAGRYRLRAEAVGVFSETSPELRLAEGEVASYAFVFALRTRELPPVRIEEKLHCVIAQEAGVAVAALWDEVRKALMATHLTTVGGRARFNLVQYERELDAASMAVRRSRSWERIGTSTQPYGSLSADSLAARGYVQTTPEGTWYYAPDARTLLSDAFVRTHCLRPVAPDSDHPGMVGLGFEPIRRRELPDVRGVLWLDSSTSELRHLQYSYTGLPLKLDDHEFGGRVEFERLPSSAWVVQRWYIRMPKLTRAIRYNTSPVLELGVPQQMARTSQEIVTGIIERGGYIKNRVGAEADSQVREFASLDGTAFDSTRGRPLREADVWVEVGGQAVPVAKLVSDSVGAFRWDSVPAGDYVISITHPRLDTLGASLAPVSLSLQRGESRTITFRTPSSETIIRSICPAAPRYTTMIRGAVRREPAGAPVPRAPVIARWDPEPGAGALMMDGSEMLSAADENGYFTLCGVPRGRVVELQAVDGQRRGEPLSLGSDSASASIVELLLPVAGFSKAFYPRIPGAITGVVSGADGTPIAGASVRVLMSEFTVRTDERGAYWLRGLTPGRHVLEVRAIGYKPVQRLLVLGPESADTVHVSLTQVAQPLDAIRTVGQRDPYRTGFYDRMTRSHGGFFLTSARIRASGTRKVTELLGTVPGVKIRKVGQVSMVELAGRGARTQGVCQVFFVLDGVPFEPGPGFGLDGEIGLDDLEAIEVYDAATAPAQFSGIGAGCGVVLLWTREKSVYADEKSRDETGSRIKKDLGSESEESPRKKNR